MHSTDLLVRIHTHMYTPCQETGFLQLQYRAPPPAALCDNIFLKKQQQAFFEEGDAQVYRAFPYSPVPQCESILLMWNAWVENTYIHM